MWKKIWPDGSCRCDIPISQGGEGYKTEIDITAEFIRAAIQFEKTVGKTESMMIKSTEAGKAHQQIAVDGAQQWWICPQFRDPATWLTRAMVESISENVTSTNPRATMDRASGKINPRAMAIITTIPRKNNIPNTFLLNSAANIPERTTIPRTSLMSESALVW